MCPSHCHGVSLSLVCTIVLGSLGGHLSQTLQNLPVILLVIRLSWNNKILIYNTLTKKKLHRCDLFFLCDVCRFLRTYRWRTLPQGGKACPESQFYNSVPFPPTFPEFQKKRKNKSNFPSNQTLQYYTTIPSRLWEAREKKLAVKITRLPSENMNSA